MPYRKPHPDCSENDCQSYSAYIRVQKKWIKAGEYNSECKTFTAADNVRTYDDVKREEFWKMAETNPYLRKLLKLDKV